MYGETLAAPRTNEYICYIIENKGGKKMKVVIGIVIILVLLIIILISMYNGL